MIIKTVYHFVDSNLGFEISSKKEGLKEKEGPSFGRCYAWERGNDLPWERKDLYLGDQG